MTFEKLKIGQVYKFKDRSLTMKFVKKVGDKLFAHLIWDGDDIDPPQITFNEPYTNSKNVEYSNMVKVNINFNRKLISSIFTHKIEK